MRAISAATGVLTLVCGLAAVNAFGQTVYKCADKNGNAVFTTDPCGKDAKLVSGTPPKPRSKPTVGDEDETRTPIAQAPKRRERTAVDDISDSVDDSNCRRSARNSYIEPSTAKIDNAKAEIRDLQNTSYSGGTAAQRQLMAEGNETKIIGLRNIISTEESRNDQLRKESDERLRKALEVCDKAKGDREKAATQP